MDGHKTYNISHQIPTLAEALLFRLLSQRKCQQWLLSLYLVGGPCAQWKMGGSFVKVVDQNFPPIFHKTPLFFTAPLIFNLHP